MSTEQHLIEIANSSHSLLSTDARRAGGFSDKRWARVEASGLWIQVVPDCFRHAATPLTLDMRIRAGAAWLGRRGALFGETALWWLDVEVPEPRAAQFLVPRGRRSVANWMEIHTTERWDNADVILHRGVRTAAATRAVIDFATQGPTASVLEHAIDGAIRARRTSFVNLTRRLQGLRGSGRHGVVLLSELLLDAGGDSHLERRFLRLLRNAGLPRPKCQVVMRAGGQRIARVDFHFAGLDTVVEVSGRLGHVSDRDRQRDARRRNHLQQDLGQKVLEFTTADVIDDPTYVVESIRKELHP